MPELTYVTRARGLAARRRTRSTPPSTTTRSGDFKPYLLKSTDRGRELDARSPATCPSAGTVYVAGRGPRATPTCSSPAPSSASSSPSTAAADWIQLKGGLPTIAVRDLEIQRRENDLVLATFGRGFYILDDYTPLRRVTRELLEREAVLFPVKDALRYVERRARARTPRATPSSPRPTRRSARSSPTTSRTA